MGMSSPQNYLNHSIFFTNSKIVCFGRGVLDTRTEKFIKKFPYVGGFEGKCLK